MKDRVNKLNVRHYLSLVSLLWLGITVSAQTIRIEARKNVMDDAFAKSQSILPVYKFDSMCIEPYAKFGVDMGKNQAWYTIKKLPNMTGCKDTGYTYIYFSGADNAINKGYLLTLIGNYVRSRRTMYFYIDRNNDFDFTNDGAPDSITIQQNDFQLELENTNVKGAIYAIKLSRFVYGENMPYKNLLTTHYKAHSGAKEFTNINYCFREQRYNAISADYKGEKDSFTIGIKDMNVNGVYNESCTDMLYIGTYKSQIASDELFSIIPVISNNAFEWGEKKYRILTIESTGSYIEIKEDENAQLSNKLELGKKVPGFDYFNILSKKHSLKEYRKKEVFLFFWDKETLSDEDRTYLSKINTEFSEEIKIITLNHGDEPKQVRITYYYDKIDWPVGYSNSEIGAKYFLEDVNRGFYVGKHRILKKDNIMPKAMYELLLSKRK
jgi:hypothetical protein